MKPPFQTRPQQQYSTTRADDHLAQRSSSRHPPPSIASTPLVIPQMYVPPHASIPHQYLAMLPKPGDPAYHLEPRFSTAMIPGSLPRPQIPSVASISTSHPSSSYQAKRPSAHRVSLLQDIRISGERDRDGLSSAPGLGLTYGGSAPPRRTSLPASHGALARPAERPGAISSHSPYQPHIPSHSQLQKEHPSHVRHTVTSTPQAFPVLQAQSHTEIKKEPPVAIKQEMGLKIPHQHILQEQASTSAAYYRQPSVKPEQVGHPAAAHTEQKSKEDLVQAMDKVDREITKVETEINRLQKKKTQLEESAMKPPEPEKSDSSPQRVEPKHRDLWQVIYAENRKKAEAARSVLDGLCKKYEMPLYNQPSDTDVYQKNLEKNEEMRPKLLTYFQNRMKLQNIREQYLCARYDQLMDQWQQKAAQIESNPKRKAKEAKSREFFEKLFPEVRKQREQQERIDRVGTRGDTCRSEADLAEIVDGLSEQENQLQHMRQLAVIPPMLLDKEQRRIRFINNNGHLNEPFKEFKESQQLDAWSDQEKAIFTEKFVQHPKNFQLVASFIEKKSVADCILYYYLTKKTNHYKALIRKQSLKPKKLKSGKHHNYTPQPSSSKDSGDKTKDDLKKESETDAEESRIDKPPSPRMTRARKQTMNWTEDEISVVKEGFGKHGRDFSAISRMVANKTEQQVKNFYHNYKKKHGLDQLIERKKKKTSESRRTRHQAQSPDVVATATEEEERKNTESPLVEDKSKADKSDDTGLTDDKKQKSKDRTPSPAVSVSGKTTDTSEPATQSTSHIRTRRTAALAAATAQDNADSNSAKRPNSSKSPALAQGEPAEKKQKKNERKSRKEKNLSESSATKSTPQKDEAKTVDKEKIADSTKTDNKQSEPTSSKADEKPEQALSKVETQVEVPTSKEPTNKNISNVVAKQPLSSQADENDSSATCSADEDTNTDGQAWKLKPKLPQDAFDYDFNDSPVINLDAARHTVTCGTSVTTGMSTMTVSSMAAPGSTKIVIVSSKPSQLEPPSLNLSRPQSLPPPGAMLLPPVAGIKTTATTMPLKSGTVITSVADNSRPSSTPAASNLPQTNKTLIPSTKSQPTSIANKEQNVGVHSQTVSVVQRQPIQTTVIDSIKNLTYQPGKIAVPFVSVSSSGRTFTVSMPTVMDLTADKKPPAPSSGENTKPASSMPATSHQHFAPSTSIAASLQKDFRAGVTLPESRHTIPAISSSYQRTYTTSEVRTMQDKAASLPPPPAVPVSALRFTTTGAGIPPSQYRQSSPAQASTAIQKILALQPGDPIPHTVTGPRFGSITTGTPIVPPAHPTTLPQSTPMPNPISSMAYRPSPNLVSIRSGKPVARNPLLNPTDGHDTPSSSKVTASSAPVRHAAIQGLPSTRSQQFVDAAKIVTSLPPAPILPGQAPVFWPPGLQHGGRFPTPVISQAQTPGVIKSEKSSESSAALQAQAKLEEARLSDVYRRHLGHGFVIPPKSDLRSFSDLSAKRKISDEPSPTPKSVQHVIQRSSTPPQMKVTERKPSRGPTPGKIEATPRYPPPIMQEKQHKEESKHADTPRFVSERRSVVEPTLSTTQRSLSAHSLAPSTRSLSEVRSPAELLHPAGLDSMLLRGGLPILPMPGNTDPQVLAALMQQYLSNPYGLVPGLPPHPALRSFSPSGNESLESSRHNVLQHDFATALQMKQHLPSPASIAAASARGSPFSTITPVTSVQPPIVVSSSVNPIHSIVAAHRSNSPSPSRSTFIAQNPPHVSHVRTSSNPARNTPSKSPSSPHRSTTPHHIVGKPPYPPNAPQLYSHIPDLYHPGVERRKSSSPHRVPSTDFHTQVTQSALVTQFAPHEARRTPPAPYGTPPPPRQTPSVDRTVSGSPLVGQRSSHSPHAQQSRAIKRDPAPEQHRVAERDVTHNSELHSGLPNPLQHERYRSNSLTGQNPLLRPSHESSYQPERKEHNEPSEKADDRYTAGHVKTAADLRMKGRATMTPAHLISAIIDHNIHREYDLSVSKPSSNVEPSAATHRPSLSSMQRPEVDHRHPGKPPAPVSAPATRPQPEVPQQPLVNRPKGITPSVGAAPLMGIDRLEEHSHEIISDMFHKEANEKKLIEQRQQEVMKPRDSLSGFQMQDRSTIMQHPLAPQALQNPSTPLENLIRSALLNEGSSRGGSPAPQEVAERSPRLDPNRASPHVHSSVSSPSNRNKNVEIKREASQYHSVAPTSVNQAPMFISALAFKAGQNSASNQSIPTASNLAQRTSVVAAGPGSVHAPHMSPYHQHGSTNPQAQQPVIERPPPMTATQYEDLSDSD